MFNILSSKAVEYITVIGKNAFMELMVLDSIQRFILYLEDSKLTEDSTNWFASELLATCGGLH